MIRYQGKKFINKGYITLLSVLVVGAVGIAITTSLILLGLSSSNTSFTYQQMHQAKNIANACAEEALEKIRESTAFVGSGNLSIGLGACTYNVVNTGGESRLIEAMGTIDTVVRKTTVNISAINPIIVVISWQEL